MDPDGCDPSECSFRLARAGYGVGCRHDDKTLCSSVYQLLMAIVSEEEKSRSADPANV